MEKLVERQDIQIIVNQVYRLLAVPDTRETMQSMFRTHQLAEVNGEHLLL